MMMDIKEGNDISKDESSLKQQIGLTAVSINEAVNKGIEVKTEVTPSDRNAFVDILNETKIEPGEGQYCCQGGVQTKMKCEGFCCADFQDSPDLKTITEALAIANEDAFASWDSMSKDFGKERVVYPSCTIVDEVASKENGEDCHMENLKVEPSSSSDVELTSLSSIGLLNTDVQVEKSGNDTESVPANRRSARACIQNVGFGSTAFHLESENNESNREHVQSAEKSESEGSNSSDEDYIPTLAKVKVQVQCSGCKQFYAGAKCLQKHKKLRCIGRSGSRSLASALRRVPKISRIFRKCSGNSLINSNQDSSNDVYQTISHVMQRESVFGTSSVRLSSEPPLLYLCRLCQMKVEEVLLHRHTIHHYSARILLDKLCKCSGCGKFMNESSKSSHQASCDKMRLQTTNAFSQKEAVGNKPGSATAAEGLTLDALPGTPLMKKKAYKTKEIYRCEKCGLSFKGWYFAAHVKWQCVAITAEDKNIAKCDICNKLLMQFQMAKHQHEHDTGDIVKCSGCGKYGQKKNIVRHRKRCSASKCRKLASVDTLVKCSKCETYGTKKHIRGHERKCGISTTTSIDKEVVKEAKIVEDDGDNNSISITADKQHGTFQDEDRDNAVTPFCQSASSVPVYGSGSNSIKTFMNGMTETDDDVNDAGDVTNSRRSSRKSVQIQKLQKYFLDSDSGDQYSDDDFVLSNGTETDQNLAFESSTSDCDSDSESNYSNDNSLPSMNAHNDNDVLPSSERNKAEEQGMQSTSKLVRVRHNESNNTRRKNGASNAAKVKFHTCVKCNTRVDGKPQRLIRHYERKHELIPTGERSCYSCGKTKDGGDILQHLREIHGECEVVPPNHICQFFDKYTCRICGVKMRALAFASHMQWPCIPANLEDKEPVDCEICGKVMPRFKLPKHMHEHNTGEILKCLECGKYVVQIYLKSHNKSHDSMEAKVKCVKCGVPVAGKSLEFHMQAVHGGAQFNTCPRCGKRVLQAKIFEHKCNRPELKCNFCTKVFFIKYRLNRHIQNCHTQEIDSSKRMVCGHCSKEFLFTKDLRRHIEIFHKKKFGCKECSKIFTCKSDFEDHTNVHRGKMPYECEVCHKKFSEKKTLAKHLRTHTQSSVCSICGLNCSNYMSLYRHKRTHSNIRPYKCVVCHQMFSQKSSMMRHMLIHTGEKPIVCHLCGAAFRQSSLLKNHLAKNHPEN